MEGHEHVEKMICEGREWCDGVMLLVEQQRRQQQQQQAIRQ
jgi:hypothetical protein